MDLKSSLLLSGVVLIVCAGCSRFASPRDNRPRARGRLRVASSGDDRFHRQPEYDLSAGPARLRIFADNYQFLLFDYATNPFIPRPEINRMTSDRGWTGNDHAVWFFTRAHYNDHRLDVRLARRYAPDPSADRETAHPLRLPGGMLALFEHPHHVRFRVPPGDYTLYCRAYSLGKENPEGMAHLSDSEFFRHDEWEHYEIVFVPGLVPEEGEP